MSLTSSSHNRQFIQNSTQRANAPVLRRNELSHIVTFNKKKGVFTLRGRHLSWDSQEDALKVIINLDTITDRSVAYNNRKDTEMLLIKSVENPNGYIFHFEGGKCLGITLEGRKEFRDKFFELINKKDESYEEFFKHQNVFEKKRFLGIFMDDYLNFLFEHVVMKKTILTREEFWSYIKRKYFHKLLNFKTLQLVQLSRDDELGFLYQGKNILDYKFKTKLLLSNDDLNTLFEFNLGQMKKEENFWTEFLKNQKNNETEIFGGFKGLYFTNEDRGKIAEAKQMTGDTLQNSGFIKRVPGSYKMSKTFEGIEKNRLVKSNYLGPFLAVAEFDYKDKEMKEKNPDEEFNKKEMNNLIENINNYSMRKLEGVSYINQNSLIRRNKLQQIQINQKMGSSKITHTNGETVNGNHSKTTNTKIPYSKVYAKYLDMKTSNTVKEVPKRDSVEAFKKVNLV
jgi:hypothetical protein